MVYIKTMLQVIEVNCTMASKIRMLQKILIIQLVIEVYHICEVCAILFWRKEGAIVYEKFVALLEKTNKSAYQVSKDTGIAENIFSYWKSGRSTPKLDKLITLADYFDVPITYFIDSISKEVSDKRDSDVAADGK